MTTPVIGDVLSTDSDGKTVWGKRCNVIVPITPTNGQTVSFPANNCDTTLYLTPAGDLASIVISLPVGSNSTDGQMCSIVTNFAIGSISFTGGSVMGALSSMEAGQYSQFLRLSDGVWCNA
jgi:hypothetical protein